MSVKGDASAFEETARNCAQVAERVLRGDKLSATQLEALWPPRAREYVFLDEFWNDLIEFGNPGAAEMFRPLLDELVTILNSAPLSPGEAARRFREAILRWDADD